MSCCGNTFCKGCAEAVVSANSNSQHDQANSCPFCRRIMFGSLEQLRKRADIGDTEAIIHFACCFAEGSGGMPRDSANAIELYIRASELGNIQASARDLVIFIIHILIVGLK